jgi:hypothetical protein
MINLLRKLTNRTSNTYCIIARYKTGNWFTRFSVVDYTPYEACRQFDQGDEYSDWIRVSGACLDQPVAGASH